MTSGKLVVASVDLRIMHGTLLTGGSAACIAHVGSGSMSLLY